MHRTIRTAAALLQAIVAHPSVLVELGREVFDGLTYGRSRGEVHVPPAEANFSREFARQFGSSTVVSASPDEIVAVTLDFDRFGDWFGLHVGWPDGAPSRDQLAVGAVFGETLRVKGTKATLAWTVTRYDPPHTLAIEGSGPLDAAVALWISATEEGSGARLVVSGGFACDALRGPMLAVVMKALQDAADDSMTRVAALLNSPDVDSNQPAVVRNPAAQSS